jgi:segregation and condensation protein A
MTFAEKKENFTIALDNFSGPFDLLLQFVRDKKINIHEISITEITNKYLAFVRNESGFIQSSDNTDEQKTKIGLDEISECMLIIALLMEYKCKYLLPQPEDEALRTEEEEIETDLVEHLKEYQIFKEVAFNLRGRKADLAKVYSRYTHEKPQKERKIQKK